MVTIVTKIFLAKFLFVCLIKEENKFRTLTLEEKGWFGFFFVFFGGEGWRGMVS